MEFTNRSLTKMFLEKAAYNRKFAHWYTGLFLEEGGEILEVEVPNDDGSFSTRLHPVDPYNATMFNRADRIGTCMDFWHWHKYTQNKILDLQKVNRCKNRAFCPNCKMLNVARFIHEFRLQMESLKDYDFYMLTLTVPSCKMDDTGAALDECIRKLNATFQRLVRKYSAPILTPTGKPSKQALQSRYIDIVGGVRVLEVTYSEENGFHPHFHCVVLLKKGVAEWLLNKDIKGKWSIKRQSYNMKSAIDCQIGKAWTMLWNGIDFRKWDKAEYIPSEIYLKINDEDTEVKNLEVDFTPLDESGIYEVFKYTFKNSEVANYRVFKNLVYALDGKRFRQGFGILHNFRCEEFDEGETQPLELAIEETPEDVVTREISELVTQYADYKKISRFNKGVALDELSITN